MFYPDVFVTDESLPIFSTPKEFQNKSEQYFINVDELIKSVNQLDQTPGKLYYRYHFAISEDTLSKLKGREVVMVEVFYDTPNLDLLKQNIWLRCRYYDDLDDEWSLKVMVLGQDEGNTGYDFSDEITILEKLESLLGLEDTPSHYDDLVEQGKLVHYAMFETHRTVVNVGEMEQPIFIDRIKLSKEKQYTVGTIVSEHGLDILDDPSFHVILPVKSKLFTYLQENRPAIFDIMMEKGIVPDLHYATCGLTRNE
eukprot:TRINITY_DN9049_c0_g1_i1.p1 TRINITY_DN9049_c0_g1~~TRINITY_DN9049_c0_g1_i1.p1  ORF type:complete len:254 (-),score=45.73 TRINITY_DN9049_c0_g1_i1:62-823(-)